MQRWFLYRMTESLAGRARVADELAVNFRPMGVSIAGQMKDLPSPPTKLMAISPDQCIILATPPTRAHRTAPYPLYLATSKLTLTPFNMLNSIPSVFLLILRCNRLDSIHYTRKRVFEKCASARRPPLCDEEL